MIVINVKFSHGVIISIPFFKFSFTEECLFVISTTRLSKYVAKQLPNIFQSRKLLTIFAFLPMLANAEIADENSTTYLLWPRFSELCQVPLVCK